MERGLVPGSQQLRDGVGILPGPPEAAHHGLAVPHLIVLVGVQVDGGTAVVLAGGALHIAEGAGGVDGELLRSIINLRENRLHLISNGA